MRHGYCMVQHANVAVHDPAATVVNPRESLGDNSSTETEHPQQDVHIHPRSQ
jgi:hypothetical protein